MENDNEGDNESEAGSAAHQRGLRAKRAYREFKAALVRGAPGAPGTPREWMFRGYLPHRDRIGVTQSLTFRLADSLPQEKLCALEEELKALPEDKRDTWRRVQIEKWLDSGLGCCALRHPAAAGVLENGFLLNDGVRYHLLAWCVMPNHAHVLVFPAVALSRIVGSWKSYSGRWALAHNASLGLGIAGEVFWQREVWDRYMRDERHLGDTIGYIHNNPVKAGLCKRAEDWRWSSAWEGRELRVQTRLERLAEFRERVMGSLDAASAAGAPGTSPA